MDPVAAKVARVAADSSVHSLSALESTFRDKVQHLARCVGKLACERPRICPEGDCKVNDVHSERDGLQVHLNSTASEVSGARNSLMVVLERLEQHRRRSATIHFAV